jgi:hypothetical protein
VVVVQIEIKYLSQDANIYKVGRGRGRTSLGKNAYELVVTILNGAQYWSSAHSLD